MNTRKEQGMEQTRETWGSKFGYIMATAGFAVGFGSIWRFPYLAGTSGGGAFVLVYLILSLIVGLPLFTAEMVLGRKAKSTPIDGMRRLTKKGSIWVSFGWLSLGAALFIMAYYNVLLGFVLSYIVKMAKGDFVGATVESSAAIYEAYCQDPVTIAIASIIMLAILGVVVMRGLKEGIEKCCKILMPALLVMLFVVAVRSCTLEGAMEGISWFLKPDISRITPSVVFKALSQVFFATGVGMAVAFVYGSFLDEKTGNIPSDSLLIIIINTAIALIAGLCMFPAIFAFGMQPDLGPSLIFKTMPMVFSQMPFGRAFGTLFFILVLIAAALTAIGFIEAIAGALSDATKWKKKSCILITLVAIFILNIPAILSYNLWSDISIFGKNIFDFYDYISGNVMLTWAGVVLCCYIIFKWGFAGYMEDSNKGATGILVKTWWKPIVLVIAPILVIVVAIGSLLGI